MSVVKYFPHGFGAAFDIDFVDTRIFGIDCTELIKVIAEIWEHRSVMTMTNDEEETRAQRGRRGSRRIYQIY
ncbi:hypothetical protein EYF80_020512 [Liparis tanakae]|uniref:Uncharacterized protein n=1 Tax=Liparis tanakae TaxID=230148 RepID=A0A4Z2HV69_9TELE|nr:hypothetical protein EYF80_020512 [Liparis tanakae]